MKTYKEVSLEIENLNISKKDKLKSVFIAIVLGLLIIFAPFALTANLYIYIQLKKLCTFILASLLIILFFLSELFYLRGITNGNVKSLKSIIITDTFIVSLIIYGLLLIIFFMGVI